MEKAFEFGRVAIFKGFSHVAILGGKGTVFETKVWLHSCKLTYPWKFHHLNLYFPGKMGIFMGDVSFREGIHLPWNMPLNGAPFAQKKTPEKNGGGDEKENLSFQTNE